MTNDKESLRTCPECGGAEVDGMNCWEQLGSLGILEFQDPELMSLHFYTVACYNIQHPAKFTDEAIQELKKLFSEAVDKNWSNEQVRKKIGRKWDGKGNVLLKEAKESEIVEWDMTISDVYLPNQTIGTANRVHNWVKVVRNKL